MTRNWVRIAGNTQDPCLKVLRDKGYELWIVLGDDYDFWEAARGETAFSATNAAELLGLTTMHEHLGDQWRGSAPDITGELYGRAVRAPQVDDYTWVPVDGE